jgi:hypothetical protein
MSQSFINSNAVIDVLSMAHNTSSVASLLNAFDEVLRRVTTDEHVPDVEYYIESNTMMYADIGNDRVYVYLTQGDKYKWCVSAERRL